MSDKPLPISSESDGTVPAVLVAARVVLFTHTSLCMHACAYVQIFYLCTPASACAEGYFPASLSSPLLRERDERAPWLFPAVRSPQKRSAAVG